MRERPIIFNAEMVRAALNGSKTQTRQIMKVQPESNQLGLSRVKASTKRSDIGKYYWSESNATGHHIRSKLFSCPFGEVGDRLWVSETWADVNLEGIPAVAYRADNDVYSPMDDESFLDEDGAFNYDDPRVAKYEFAVWYSDLINDTEGNWRPSIHMPRWASRITLEITGVRVERLQDISNADASAEGLKDIKPWTGLDGCIGSGGASAREKFEVLWESIYGEESWQANPWVWVIEFKRVEGVK